MWPSASVSNGYQKPKLRTDTLLNTRAIVAQLDSPVYALSWSPRVPAFVYVQGPMLHAWPSGMAVKIPKSISNFGLPSYALGYSISWRDDGRRLALIVDKTDAVIFSFPELRPIERLHNVYSIWWMHQKLCVIKDLLREDYDSWDIGRREYITKPVNIATDGETDSNLLIVRRGEPPGTADLGNIVIASYAHFKGHLHILYTMFPHPVQIEFFSSTDTLSWNPSARSAAILFSADTAGGNGGISRLAVATPHGVRWPPRYNFDDVFAESTPYWVGDRILIILRFWKDSSVPNHSASNRVELGLFDPVRDAFIPLLVPRSSKSSAAISSAASASDHRTIAYAVWDGRRATIIIAKVLAS